MSAQGALEFVRRAEVSINRLFHKYMCFYLFTSIINECDYDMMDDGFMIYYCIDARFCMIYIIT